MEAIQAQLDKLKQAKHACLECGKRNGDYTARNPEFFLGDCPICGKRTRVTDAAHFGFFYRGLCKLRIHKARLERNARA